MVLRFEALVVAMLATLLFVGIPAHAQQPTFTLSIKNHQFDPAELVVPAGTRIQLTVRNLDSTPAEFESVELRREKVIPGNSEGIVYIGPLRAGRYEFFDDFHPTTRGFIVAR